MNVWNTKLKLEYKEALTFIVVKTIEIINGYIPEETDPLWTRCSLCTEQHPQHLSQASLCRLLSIHHHTKTCFSWEAHYLLPNPSPPLTNRSQRVLVKGSLHSIRRYTPGRLPRLIAGPYLSVQGFGTLLEGALVALKVSWTLSCYQHTFQVLSAPGA